MAHKQRKLSRVTLFTGLLIAGVVLLVTPQSVTKSLNFLFARLFNPVLSLGRNTAPPIFKPASGDSVTRSEYNRLKSAYDNVLADLRTEHKRYEKLARIRSALPKEGAGLVVAEVINVSIGGLKRELIVNKGDLDGLRVGQYVLGESSIVGSVSETSQSTARVRLVTDANHKIKVALWQRSKKRYIYARMDGEGTELAKVPLISREYKINVGDTVYAAPMPGFLETARVIGQVAHVGPDENEPLLWDIKVRPALDAEALTDVAIIVNGL
ncbi:MAG: rod shape-determining protein MreC [Planctomycetota bacterium]|jgi:rod shape-determining protein MreC